MCSNIDRRNCAKKIIQGRGNDVAEQRTLRRQRLVEKFKALRIRTFDSFRKLKEDELTYELLCELKRQVASTLDARDVLEAEDLSEFLCDLEKELKEVEEQENAYFEKLYVEELETITKNLMNSCHLCDDLMVESGICELCTMKYVTEQF